MLPRYQASKAELLELQDQLRQVLLNDPPMPPVVDLVIVVDDHIAQTDDPPPIDVRMAQLGGVGQAARRLSNVEAAIRRPLERPIIQQLIDRSMLPHFPQMLGSIEHIIEQRSISLLKRHTRPTCRAGWKPCDRDCGLPSPRRDRRSCQTGSPTPRANPQCPACSTARPGRT